MPTEPTFTARAGNRQRVSYAGAQLPGCRCALCEARRSTQLVGALRSKFSPSTAFIGWKKS